MPTKKAEQNSEPIANKKAIKTTPNETPVVKPADTPTNERQSQFATILIGLLIIAGGLLIYNYFQSQSSPGTTSEQAANTQASPTKATTSSPTANPSSGPTTTPTPTVSPSPTPTPVPALAASSYTVQAGDSTWTIAEKIYGDGFQYNKIVQANHLENDIQGRPVLEIGQVLTIPNASNASLQSPGTSSNHSPVASTHLIQHGETLWSIAQATYGQGGDWILIFNDPHNHLSLLPDGKPLIHAGNILYLPAAP